MAILLWIVGGDLRRNHIRFRIPKAESANGYSVGIAIMDSLPLRSEAAASVLSPWRVVLYFYRTWKSYRRTAENPYELVLGIALELWRWRVDRRLDIESA